MNRSANGRFAIRIAARALAFMLAGMMPLYAVEPPTAKQLGPRMGALRMVPSETAARAPAAKGAGAIVLPRENCGTYHTGWVDDPNVDVNPCPAACERGERISRDERKEGDKTRYYAIYRCNLPERVVNQRPDVARAIEAGGVKGTNCGTFWTGKLEDPEADANPCPANCERGELLDVRRSRSYDGSQTIYEKWYRCYRAGTTNIPAVPRTAAEEPAGDERSQTGSSGAAQERSTRPAGSAVMLRRILADRIEMRGRWPISTFSSGAVNTSPIRMTGRWPAALASTVTTAGTINMTGRWPIETFSDLVLDAPSIRMSGRWPAAMASTAVTAGIIRMTGRWPITTLSTQAVSASHIRMTGRWPVTAAATAFATDPIRMIGRWPILAAFGPLEILTDVIHMTGQSPP